MHTVNTLFTTSFPFYDLTGDLVTGLVNADFTKSAYLTSNGATTATVTVAAVTGQSGNYEASFTPTAVGRWKMLVSCDHDGFVYRWDDEVEVAAFAEDSPVTLVAQGATVVAQGATWSEGTDPITDGSGEPITDGEADITVTLFDTNNVDQSSGITVQHVSGGQYRVNKTLAADAALGSWIGTFVYDDGAGLERTQTIDFTVLASMDPFSVDAGAIAEEVVAALDVEAIADAVIESLDAVAIANAVAASLGAADITTVMLINPVGENNDLTIYVNNSYLNADGDAITMTNTEWTPYDLTGATSVWFAAMGGSVLALSKTVTVVNDTTIRFDLTRANTYAMRFASSYTIWAKLPSQTDPVLLVSGALSMQG